MLNLLLLCVSIAVVATAAFLWAVEQAEERQGGEADQERGRADASDIADIVAPRGGQRGQRTGEFAYAAS